MGYCKSEAVVLRRFDYSDTSQIVWAYTRDFGKEKLIAKGAKRVGKNALGPLDPLTHIHLVFLDKQREGLRTLTEWELIDSFEGLRQDLDRLYLASYAVELVNELTEVGEPNSKVFGILTRILSRLCVDDDHHKLIFAFEFALLRALGYLPEVTRCAHCGGGLGEEETTYFSAVEGGALCGVCGQADERGVRASRGVLAAMAGLAHGDRGFLERLRLGPDIDAEMRGLVNLYLRNLVGKDLKLAGCLGPQAVR